MSAFAKRFNSAVPVSNINHVSEKLNGLLAKVISIPKGKEKFAHFPAAGAAIILRIVFPPQPL